MSDNITYWLSEKKYNVVNIYLYGPVKDVVPYLTRRAQENTSVAGQTGRELSLIQKELERRRKKSNFSKFFKISIQKADVTLSVIEK